MILRDYEATVTVGKPHWITSFAYDATTQKLVVGLTRDPESSRTQRILEFHQVRSLCDYWIDRDDGCMEGLLGAYEAESGSDIRYVLATSQREVEIFAGTQGLAYDA